MMPHFDALYGSREAKASVAFADDLPASRPAGPAILFAATNTFVADQTQAAREVVAKHGGRFDDLLDRNRVHAGVRRRILVSCAWRVDAGPARHARDCRIFAVAHLLAVQSRRKIDILRVAKNFALRRAEQDHARHAAGMSTMPPCVMRQVIGE